MVVTTDGNGGLLVGWSDGRVSEPDIYAMHLFGATASSPTAVEELPMAEAPGLRAPWPNPSVGSVTFGFRLHHDAVAELDVIDLAGRRVARLAHRERLTAGVHQRRWDGRDPRGIPVAAGAYFVRLRYGDTRDVRRFVLVR